MLGPALIEVLKFDVPRTPQGELESRIREAIAGLRYVPAEKNAADREADSADGAGQKLTASHVDLLRSFAVRWFASLDDRCRELSNIHPEYLGRMIRDLQEMGLLGPLENFGMGKGKPKKTAFVTEKGAELLRMEYKESVPPGKGGVQHRFLQLQLKNALRNSVVEFMSGDVVQYGPDGTMTVYEIELDPGDDHFLHNIKMDLPLFGKIVVVARNPADLRLLKQRAVENLRPEVYEAIEFKTVKEVIDGAS